jgi:hypothetical protein
MSAELGYAQARIQARYAARLAEPAWSALANVADYRAFLEAARETPLRRRLRAISPHSTAHEIERQLRRELAETVHEVARWMPARWRAAVGWCAALVWLPLALHLRREGASERWMREAALAQLERLAPRLAAAEDPLEEWVRAWRALWPACSACVRAALERLVARLKAHRRSLAALAAAEALPGREAWMRRRELAERLVRDWRGDLLTPAAAFGYLLLEALELERVRAELATRALFGGGR